MGRNNNRDNNVQKLPQVPKNLKSDGLDVEYSSELADQQDIEAQARSNAANRRAHNRKL
ncbi:MULTISPECIES: YfhD family protein [unclassified Peribacillus]|uniref:YfhD family protein n=1 Tax=unclassified Peribacillus TaxID=2675266 RepID=UPI0019145429|nr:MULTISPECIES: YfhD family protein [unclassified Peribacillus]MBK5444898.1 YfhD family protein [Peribacillus sp. TH24]MBK5460382.1 YfhD family protein [Peribacillus sp. TH27]MBK5482178.1 YfhD family protein [Peribacillus sp. TH16]MBK5498555.1 YfhD family protein [Peribacillus sp. TH14]WMX56332.1 YfhD family protein [Peribacillus sp. R9-11]